MHQYLMTSYHLVLPVWTTKPHPLVDEDVVQEGHKYYEESGESLDPYRRYEFVAPHVNHKDAKYLMMADEVQVADLLLTVDTLEFHFIGDVPKQTFAIIETQFRKRLTF